jgi:hypothetical protein
MDARPGILLQHCAPELCKLQKQTLFIMKKLFFLPLLLCSILNAQNIVSTYAGNGTPGFLNGDTATARFRSPFGLCADGNGNIYIADAGNNCIRMISAAGVVTTIAGTGTAGYQDGPAATAMFNSPSDLCIDVNGNIYVSDFQNQRIRKISSGMVTTVAGSGTAGYFDAFDTVAQFNYPRGICVDLVGNIYVGDSWNHRIRKIDFLGNVTTYAGGGTNTGVGSIGDYIDAADTNARFYTPSGLNIDVNGNVYVADAYNHRIRKIDALRNVTTVAGSGITGPGNGGYQNGPVGTSILNTPTEVAIDGSGKIYFSDTFSNRIRIISNGNVDLIAGSGNSGYVNGLDVNAEFNYPRGLALNPAATQIYLCDYNNHSIRKIVLGLVGTGELINDLAIGLFPNPAIDHLTLNFNGESAAVEIFDVAGNCVYRNAAAKPGEMVDISTLSVGIYVVSVFTEGKCFNERFVKK